MQFGSFPGNAEPFWPTEDLGNFPCGGFAGLQLHLEGEARAPVPKPSVQKANQKAPQAPWQLSPSTLSKEGSVTRVPGLQAVKNTFIDVPVTPVTPAVGARQRSRSCPKDMGSKKNEWEVACHVLSYQHTPVDSTLVRKVTVEKHGVELGLDVSHDGNALLVEGVGAGAV